MIVKIDDPQAAWDYWAMGLLVSSNGTSWDSFLKWTQYASYTSCTDFGFIDALPLAYINTED